MTKNTFIQYIAVVACILLVACGPKRSIEPMAKWRTQSGANQVRLDLTEALIDNKNIPEALELLKGLREEGIDAPEIDLLQGRALAHQKLWKPAEDLLIRAAAGLPKDPRPMQALAIIYADQGKLDLAVKTLEKANLFKPNDPTILNNLGFIYLSLGQCSDAQDILQSAIELDGTQVQYRNNLAFSHVCNNDLDTALSLLRSTCSEAEARYNLGVGYELQKNEETAKEQYRLALEVNPNHSLAKHALDRLKSGARPSDLEQEEL